jgi:hypothetical protein
MPAPARGLYVPLMHLAGRGRDRSADSVDVPTEDGPALRDAGATAIRVEDDEARAASARERLSAEPLPVLDPDDAVRDHLVDGEAVHALRSRAILMSPGGDNALGYGGTLYLTSRRLVHLGQVEVTVQLTDIVETSLAGERLLLGLRQGEGLSLDLDRPRELRAEIAAAMREVRG